MRNLEEINVNEMGRPVGRPSPPEDAIRSLESLVGASLPVTYKIFLNHANGGHPELDSFVPDCAANSYDRWAVDRFYAVGLSESATQGIEWAIRSYASSLPAQCLPIACDAGGNQIALDFRTDPPSVKLYIHDDSFRELFVSDTFEAFIDKLSEDPDMI